MTIGTGDAKDAKVVGRGSADKVFVTTSGIGIITESVDLAARHVRQGAVTVVDGCLGDHGAAIRNGPRRHGAREPGPKRLRPAPSREREHARAVVPPAEADAALSAVRGFAKDREARIVGRTGTEHPATAVMTPLFCGGRIVDMPMGEHLPRTR